MATEKAYNTSSSESVRACAVEALRCVIEVAINTELLSRSEMAHILRKEADLVDGGTNDTSKEEVFEYRLWREGNKVMFRIYQQPERWRDNLLYRALQSGPVVRSICYPELDKNTIYLRGDGSDKDDNIGCLAHPTPYDAERYLIRCRETLRDFCQEQNVRRVERTAEREE